MTHLRPFPALGSTHLSPGSNDVSQPVPGDNSQPRDTAEITEGLEYWRLSALCAQTDPEAFFPDKGGSTRAAKAVCAVCPVAAECLAYALEHDERFGIWGGTSERDRRRIKRATPAGGVSA